MNCAVCHSNVTLGSSLPYALGPVRGRLCKACHEGLGAAVGRWLAKRTAEVERERVEAATAAAAEGAFCERLEAEQRPRGLRVVAGGGGR